LSSHSQVPILDQIYLRFLQDQNSAQFVHAVAQAYTIATLVRLAGFGSRVSRRASMLALSMLGDYSVNHVLGRGLTDGDRAVRLIADNGIRTIWFRSGSTEQQLELQSLQRLNDHLRFNEAVDRCTALIEATPWIAEGWNQRGIALFHLQQFNDSANDYHQALELNAYHFAAAIGMAHCYLQLQQPRHALDTFRRALALNPDLEAVRMQVEYLERSL
jgi:tetratricopeptide (TPR) repeat protein